MLLMCYLWFKMGKFNTNSVEQGSWDTSSYSFGKFSTFYGIKNFITVFTLNTGPSEFSPQSQLYLYASFGLLNLKYTVALSNCSIWGYILLHFYCHSVINIFFILNYGKDMFYICRRKLSPRLVAFWKVTFNSIMSVHK